MKTDNSSDAAIGFSPGVKSGPVLFGIGRRNLSMFNVAMRGKQAPHIWSRAVAHANPGPGAQTELIRATSLGKHWNSAFVYPLGMVNPMMRPAMFRMANNWFAAVLSPALQRYSPCRGATRGFAYISGVNSLEISVGAWAIAPAGLIGVPEPGIVNGETEVCPAA